MNNQPAASSQTSPASKQPANKNLIIIIVAVVIVVIIAIIGAIFFINSNKDDNNSSENDNQTSQDSNDSSNQEQKTLAISKLSVKYPSDSWQEEAAEDDNVSISKGDDYYLMLAHTTGEEQGAPEGETLTTEEFADIITEAYEEMGFEQSGGIKDQTINGKTWKRILVNGEGVWLTMLFYADGDDYYVATFGSESKDVPTEAEDILKTLTVK